MIVIRESVGLPGGAGYPHDSAYAALHKLHTGPYLPPLSAIADGIERAAAMAPDTRRAMGRLMCGEYGLHGPSELGDIQAAMIGGVA
jgi:hypothetical protein